MPHQRLRAAAAATVLTVALPLGAVAQDAPADDASDQLPVIEGLGWFTSIDVTGADLESVYSEDEVQQWVDMLGVAGATVEDLEYTYQKVIDPATLPQLGGLATVRIAGATEDDVLAAVIADTSTQAASLGAETPASEQISLGGKDVTRIDLPQELGPDDAYVYVRGDTAWVFIMQESLAELGLREMP